MLTDLHGYVDGHVEKREYDFEILQIHSIKGVIKMKDGTICVRQIVFCPECGEVTGVAQGCGGWSIMNHECET